MKNSIYLWICSYSHLAISTNGCGTLGEVGGSVTSQIGINPSVDKSFRYYCLNDIGVGVIILKPEDLFPIGEVG